MSENESSSPEKAPILPGIVAKGSEESEVESPIAEVNPLVRLAMQFFVIPMTIVIFCVALVFIFQWLTWEKKDLSAYIQAIHSTSRTASQKEQEALKLLNYIQEAKQWQSIYDVTQELRFNREKFLAANPDFPAKIAQLFRETPSADHRTRQYLAQVLGLIGGKEVTSVLLDALNDSDTETVIHSMIALGRIGDTSAIPKIIELSNSGDAGVRQTAIFVLGSYDDPAALQRCYAALGDPDQLVVWNAAFSLGRHQDPRAVSILRHFLDQEFTEKSAREYASVSSSRENGNASSAIMPERLEQYRATAVRMLGMYPDPGLKKELETVAREDKQMKVRQAAIDALKPSAGAKT